MTKLERFKYKTGDIVRTVNVKLYDNDEPDTVSYTTSSCAVITARIKRNASNRYGDAIYWAVFQGSRSNRELVLLQRDIIGKI